MTRSITAIHLLKPLLTSQAQARINSSRTIFYLSASFFFIDDFHYILKKLHFPQTNKNFHPKDASSITATNSSNPTSGPVATTVGQVPQAPPPSLLVPLSAPPEEESSVGSVMEASPASSRRPFLVVESRVLLVVGNKRGDVAGVAVETKPTP